MRIVWQSFVDPGVHVDYFALLRGQLEASADPGVTIDVIGIDPPDRDLHRLTETRCASRAIANAIAAEREGADAFAIGHFQDSGLLEARSSVAIPVLGLGETTMLHACTLGFRIGLVTIDPYFIPWHVDQVARYGLRERVVGVRAMRSFAVEDYVRACADDDTFGAICGAFEEAAAPLIEAGADVLIPAGGLPALVLARRAGLEIDGAVVLNGVPVLAKLAEAAVRLGALGLPVASRRAAFALPSERARDEFLSSLT
ncbi:MAG TPA: aspartate/glutamate racemase family protein [Solirubrobacteraceae bacterium]|jgi:Asp/Glu/hydantoin racemase|nr:aspartate/glutamate racemase family protein [Solirubrobacteraceae bacterium]